MSESRAADGPSDRVRLRRAVAVAALAAVPVLIVAAPSVPLAVLLGPAGLGVLDPGALGGLPPALAALLAAAVVGLGGSALAGSVLVDRRIARLPEADLDDRPADFVADRVETIAAEVGVDAPALTVVRADAANVAVTDGYRGARLVVSTRLLRLPAADRDAALRHALVRLETREAAVTTALLPAMALVETVALLATLLVGRRPERTAADRRVNRIHGYEPERNRVPPQAYTVAGVLLWLLLLPVWVPAVVGERLYVGGGRRDADAAVARCGREDRDGLGNAVAFAGEAVGAADWPPLLDRLSFVSMADAETGRVRGASRQEARFRLALLRSKRSL
jgi:Zn-dependent protease with chaperone function